MIKKRILDKNISRKNYGAFKKTSVVDAGCSILVEYNNNEKYKIPLDYMLEWNPEFRLTKKRMSDSNPLRIMKTRRVMRGTCINIYLSDARVFQIAWDSVLIAGEPQYEHFGGFSLESKKFFVTNYNRIKKA